jgi:hypothetical protein
VVPGGADKRLVIRMLELWRRARRADQLPHTSVLTPSDVGADAAHLFQIDVLGDSGARFTHIGSGLHLPDWPVKPAPLVMECPEDSVLSLSSRHWREIVTRRVPVTRGGISRHLGGLVLYRSIMLPLADDNGRISTIIGAANWRTVEEQPPTPIE